MTTALMDFVTVEQRVFSRWMFLRVMVAIPFAITNLLRAVRGLELASGGFGGLWKSRYAGANSSAQGPVRTNNEDCLDFWRPATPEDMRTRGAVAILADGVGGHGNGEVASKMACDLSKAAFLEGKPGTAAAQLLWQMFNAANLAVYDQGMKDRLEGRMLTTLTVSVFRNNEVTIGHVGDTRVYGRSRPAASGGSPAITPMPACSSSLG